MVAAINHATLDSGVTGSITALGQLELHSKDGRGIVVETSDNSIEDVLSLSAIDSRHSNYGRLTLVQHNSSDIELEEEAIGLIKEEVAQVTLSLQSIQG